MSHGATAWRQIPFRERRKFVRRVISIRSRISLALSHQRMAVNAGPAGAGQGRQPAEPGARARALTGVGWSGSASPGPTAEQRQVCAAPLPHCTDMLSAMENSDFRKVRPCQKSCNKPLHCHTTDRRAPCALYPAIKRSVVCASPVLRYPSPNRDRRKDKPTAPTVNSEQIRCGRCADLHDRSRFARWRPGRRSCRG